MDGNQATDEPGGNLEQSSIQLCKCIVNEAICNEVYSVYCKQ